MSPNSCQPAPKRSNRAATHDLILRDGTVYDGSGSPSISGDVAIQGDRIVAVGDLPAARGRTEISVAGMAVAPGFINMMSLGNESLIADGRSQSNVRQGVTLEVMGEGKSMGPLNERMTRGMAANQGDIKYDVEWTTLDEYLRFLERRGISCNVASFIGATTPRVHVIGYEDRTPTREELRRMQELVRRAMKDGAVGVASSLVYPPACFAETDELIALAKVAAEYDGLYASHIRSEGVRLIEAVEEFLTIARMVGGRAEVYHLKAAGQENWEKLDLAIAMLDEARAEGMQITGNVYTYTASSTGLISSLPPWVQAGGFYGALRRLQNPDTRRRIAQEIRETCDGWENIYLQAGSPDRILLVGFKTEDLRPLTGKTLGEVARMRGTTPEETAVDLVVEDRSRISTVYFSQSKENLRRIISLPWVSFCSDSPSLAAEGLFLKSSVHPRAYGSFARLLSKFVREEKLISLTEAVRKLTGLPAGNLRIDRRGLLREGYFADVVVFDPGKIQDHATFEDPHRYATGMVHVFVNGVQVLRDGEHTDATPGRAVRGPGWKGR